MRGQLAHKPNKNLTTPITVEFVVFIPLKRTTILYIIFIYQRYLSTSPNGKTFYIHFHTFDDDLV